MTPPPKEEAKCSKDKVQKDNKEKQQEQKAASN